MPVSVPTNSRPLATGSARTTRRDLVRRQVAVDRLPGPAAVGAPEQVGLVVGELVARGGDIDRVGIVRRDLDAADIGQLRHALGRDVLPDLAVVARDMHQAVVGRGPDLALAVRRFDDAGAGRMDLGAGAFAGDRRRPMRPGACASLRLRSGEIALPAHALVAGAEHAVAADIERVGSCGENTIGKVQAKRYFRSSRRDAGRFLGPDVDQLDLARAVVVALQRAGAAGAGADGADIDDVVVARIDGDEAALAGAGIGAVASVITPHSDALGTEIEVLSCCVP